MKMTQPPPAESFAPPRARSGPITDVWTQPLHLTSGGILAGILVLGAVVRLALLGRHSLWFDEAFVVWITRFRWQEIPSALRALDSHPPLYYLLMKAWVSVAGASEVALRFPSVCFSILAVALTYALMRRTSSETVSLLGAFLVSLSPLAIMTGQEARMYSLLSALALGSTLALIAGVEHGGLRRWTAYVVVAALMVYTQYLAVFVLVAHGVWVAGYERRHLMRWGVGVAAVAALFAPWFPAQWDQTLHVHGRLLGSLTYREPGDLLGLFAFGGSLFGMGSYFSESRLAPLEQGIVLLPFLVVLGCGVASFRSDRRSLALLGLPPAITIGAMLALSLAKPAFSPRWFSFLVPFYAMVLARGIGEIADAWRGRRERVVAVLTAAILLYGAAVLSRYYLDPGFRPFRWRAAVALVENQARPTDLLVYAGLEPRIVFAYYLRTPHPALMLETTATGPGRAFTAIEAGRLAARYPRVWLVATVPADPGSPFMQHQLFPALETAFRVVGGREFGEVWVYLLEATPPRT